MGRFLGEMVTVNSLQLSLILLLLLECGSDRQKYRKVDLSSNVEMQWPRGQAYYGGLFVTVAARGLRGDSFLGRQGTNSVENPPNSRIIGSHH